MVEFQVLCNVGLGYLVSIVCVLDSDFGESGCFIYEIVDGNDDYLFEIDLFSGEICILYFFWEDVMFVVELVVKVIDYGKFILFVVVKFIICLVSGFLFEGVFWVNGEQYYWDMLLLFIVILSIIFIIFLVVMIIIVVKCKCENKEICIYNCCIVEYSYFQLGGGKGKKKKINKNDIMLVQSEVEERNVMNVMNVVSSFFLVIFFMYFDYQICLFFSLFWLEVMYFKLVFNNLIVFQGYVGCYISFIG